MQGEALLQNESFGQNHRDSNVNGLGERGCPSNVSSTPNTRERPSSRMVSNGDHDLLLFG